MYQMVDDKVTSDNETGGQRNRIKSAAATKKL